MAKTKKTTKRKSTTSNDARDKRRKPYDEVAKIKNMYRVLIGIALKSSAVRMSSLVDTFIIENIMRAAKGNEGQQSECNKEMLTALYLLHIKTLLTNITNTNETKGK